MGRLPFVFMEWRDLPPADPIRQAIMARAAVDVAIS